MKKPLLQAAAAATVIALALPSIALAQNLAVVNGTPVPKSTLDMVKQQLTAAGHPVTPDQEKQLREGLIQREVLVQEAHRLGLDATQDYKFQMEQARQTFLINQLIDNYVKKNPVSDAQAKKAYDGAVSGNNAKEYRVLHILVKSEDLAKKTIAQIKGGAKFTDLAKKESIDTGSSSKGGDLGWATPSDYAPEFADAITKLHKGEMTQTPVKTQYGWHVIRLDDIRPMQPPSFEEIKPQVIKNLQRQGFEEYAKKLLDKAKVQ
ncbi:MAG: peptidylprolyl isomerase [Burkholderiaceae bacterium]|jgi:peptidyl-prolyl cis-trans isomerase C|nr:peptidylprolyl isomerase [Burkholderiaceae bacterium]